MEIDKSTLADLAIFNKEDFSVCTSWLAPSAANGRAVEKNPGTFGYQASHH
jgi:hypothetical protein